MRPRNKPSEFHHLVRDRQSPFQLQACHSFYLSGELAWTSSYCFRDSLSQTEIELQSADNLTVPFSSHCGHGRGFVVIVLCTIDRIWLIASECHVYKGYWRT